MKKILLKIRLLLLDETHVSSASNLIMLVFFSIYSVTGNYHYFYKKFLEMFCEYSYRVLNSHSLFRQKEGLREQTKGNSILSFKNQVY